LKSSQFEVGRLKDLGLGDGDCGRVSRSSSPSRRGGARSEKKAMLGRLVFQRRQLGLVRSEIGDLKAAIFAENNNFKANLGKLRRILQLIEGEKLRNGGDSSGNPGKGLGREMAAAIEKATKDIGKKNEDLERENDILMEELDRKRREIENLKDKLQSMKDSGGRIAGDREHERAKHLDEWKDKAAVQNAMEILGKENSDLKTQAGTFSPTKNL
jgi:chromosome segregation ATPase